MSQSAGTLIGAILESTGYHYQSAVLDAMANPFASEVGGLIYLVGIVVAVACVATRGSYKLGPWLLIGPPLFFATVQPRDEIPNARWQHGRQERPQERVDAGVEHAGITRGPPEETADGDAGEKRKPPRVSRLFERYVQLVSTTTNEIVHRISRGRENADLSFLLKSELFALMHTARIDDVGFQRLLHHAVLMECGQLIAWGRMANDPLFRKSTNPVTGERYEATTGAREAREFLRPSQQYALKKYNELYAQAEINLHDEAARYVAMLRISEKAREGQIEEGPSEEQIQDETRRVRSEVTSCREIWGYTVRSILGHAERSHEKLRDLGEHLGIDRSVLDNLLAQAQGDPLAQPLVYGKDSPAISATQAEQIGRAISVYLLRNEEANPDRGSWIAYFANRHESRNIRMRAQSFNSLTEQARVAVREWAEKERLIHAAGSLPYLQGLALYFLGITFPFFALLLLVPGKQSGFLLWFVLWLWVKSWDIGVAIVMLLEDTIFAILAVERQVLGHVPKLDANSDMGIAFAILRDLDPTFQLGTYYSIIGTCILAVPPAMGQLILGSMRAGVLLVARGSSQFSQIFADAALAHDTRSAMQALRGDASALKRERARQYTAALRHGRSLVDAAAARPGAAARAGSDGGGCRGASTPVAAAAVAEESPGGASTTATRRAGPVVQAAAMAWSGLRPRCTWTPPDPPFPPARPGAGKQIG